MEVSFTVGLKDPVSYSIIWFLMALALMALAGIVFSLFWWRYRKVCARNAEELKVIKPPAVVLPFLRRKYGRQIARLDTALRADEVEDRIAYQELSRIIRAFVNDTTGIETQNYTLQEIEALNIPQLTRLMREYVKPEFSEEGKGNVTEALLRTGQVVQAWR